MKISKIKDQSLCLESFPSLPLFVGVLFVAVGTYTILDTVNNITLADKVFPWTFVFIGLFMFGVSRKISLSIDKSVIVLKQTGIFSKKETFKASDVASIQIKEGINANSGGGAPIICKKSVIIKFKTGKELDVTNLLSNGLAHIDEDLVAKEICEVLGVEPKRQEPKFDPGVL